MIFTLPVIIGSSIALVIGILGGGIGGYVAGNRTREQREIQQNYDNLFNDAIY